MSDSYRSQLEFDVTIKRSDNVLTIDYSIKNASEKRVWLFNELFDADLSGKYEMNPGKVYLELVGDHVLYVSKRLIPVPPNIAVEFPEIPCVNPLDPGKTVTETLELRFPLKENLPYQLGDGKTIELDGLKKIRLGIGWFEDDPEVYFYTGEDVNGESFTYPRYLDGLTRQEMVRRELDV